MFINTCAMHREHFSVSRAKMQCSFAEMEEKSISIARERDEEGTDEQRWSR